MNAGSPDDAPDQPPALDDVIAEYIQAREQGEPLDHAAWLARFPALAGELAAFFSTYERMQALAPALQPGLAVTTRCSRSSAGAAWAWCTARASAAWTARSRSR